MILMRRIFQSNAAFGKWQCKEVFLSFARCISVKLLFAFVWTEKNTKIIYFTEADAEEIGLGC